MTLTNDQLDAAIATEADAAMLQGLATTDRLAALFAERSRRLAARQAKIEAAELDEDRAAEVVTVKITATQSDRLGTLLPESLCGLTLLTSRVKGTREQLATALDFLDEDLAWEFMLPQLWTDEETQTDFAERQVRASVANLRRRIRAAL